MCETELYYVQCAATSGKLGIGGRVLYTVIERIEENAYSMTYSRSKDSQYAYTAEGWQAFNCSICNDVTGSMTNLIPAELQS